MRFFPRQAQKSVALYHLPTASGKQPYPSTPNTTVMAGLLPMNNQAHVLAGGDLVEAFELYFDPGVDVRVTDKVVIDDQIYFIKKIFDASYFGGHPHKRATVSKQP